MSLIGSFIPVLMNALTYVCILALVGLGLAIIFGMMDIMNMAHGEFITIGAYTLSFIQSLGGPGAGCINILAGAHSRSGDRRGCGGHSRGNDHSSPLSPDI
ncbi:hypothetical protein MTX20_35085 [Bradyrhizobium sp. ISRA435]|nr:hypothetical protein MTX20_35085 [Bradyrhizobium sp. ISRA435]